MKVVLDEGVPKPLAAALRSAGVDAHEFKPAWSGMSNGKLLAALERVGFEILLTNDKNMAYQQSLGGRAFAVVSLPTNRVSIILPRLADIVDTLYRAKPGQFVSIELHGARAVRVIGPDGRILVSDLPTLAPF